MSDFSKKLKEANQKRASANAKISDLTVDKVYPIIDVKEVPTTYGQKIKVCLEIEDDLDCWYYLGDEYSQIFNQTTTSQVKSGDLRLHLRYDGLHGKKQMYQIITGEFVLLVKFDNKTVSCFYPNL